MLTGSALTSKPLLISAADCRLLLLLPPVCCLPVLVLGHAKHHLLTVLPYVVFHSSLATMELCLQHECNTRIAWFQCKCGCRWQEKALQWNPRGGNSLAGSIAGAAGLVMQLLATQYVRRRWYQVSLCYLRDTCYCIIQ